MKGANGQISQSNKKFLSSFNEAQLKTVNTYTKFMIKSIRRERRCKLIFLFSLVLTLLNGYLDITMILTSGEIIDRIRLQGDGQMRLWFKFLSVVLTHYFVSAFSKMIMDYFEIVFSRTTLYNSISSTIKMSHYDFHKIGCGKAQENIVNGSRALGEAASILLTQIPEMIIFGIFCTYAICDFFNQKTVVVLVGGSILGTFFSFLLGLYIDDGESVKINMFNDQLFRLADILTNFDVVKTFNRSETDIARYRDSLIPCNWYEIKYSIIKQSLVVIQRIFIYTPHFFALYWIINNSESIGFTVSKVFLYNECFENYRSNFTAIREAAYTVLKAKAEGLWIIENDRVLSEEQAVKTIKRDNEAHPQSEGDVRPCNMIRATFTKNIVMRNCNLYAGLNLIQANFNVQINPGELVAITGENGSGKSTFLKTLLGLNRFEGEFSVDGVPIEKLEEGSYRNLISYVPQESSIFNDTVLNNLSYGQSKPDLEEIYHQCKLYGYHEFFLSLKDGYQTNAGESGMNLSGGQRQRVNFMRGVLRGCPIIILDEPSASLDKVSELEMVDNLVLLNKRGITVLIIVHNHDLLRKFDKILYFTRKAVTEYTSYEKFVRSNKS